MLSIGKTIKELRQLRGLSLNQVAEKADMDKSYLSKIENEKRDPSLSSLFRISKALNVPLNILILMCEEPSDSPFSDFTENLKSMAREIIKSEPTA
ncbi:helix-turn-helix domain-containing protein [Oceanimonas baumannii]|uniref:Transcriptional regulator n=1 Tax=Oceanimonas baumannii TaxID=129578 RepID=A0A235C9E1_9GAMM|nr:helix-turn-helix transcriptional regulator [Oceanimonas baumannii]OYD21044.1 transcriptional regulator [Oceanimonas baumannii]